MIEFTDLNAQQARIKNRTDVGLQRARQSTPSPAQQSIATAFGLEVTGKCSRVASGTATTGQPSSRPMPSGLCRPHKILANQIKNC